MDLTGFARSPLPGLRIAVVYGRRRQGRSYLLRRLTGAVGGLYHLATEQAEPVSLRRFGDSLAAWAGLSAGAFGFGGMGAGAADGSGGDGGAISLARLPQCACAAGP
jgi:hypothetical protein